MPRGLSYADAVRLLGGSGPLAQVADNLLGGLLSVATAGGSDVALSLFDAKAEAVRLGGLVTVKINEVVRGLGRYRRSERLLAAHGVLVVAAVFEALDDCFRAAGLEPAEFTRDDQLMLLGSPAGRDAVTRLLGAPIPLPSPELSYDGLLDAIRGWCGPVADHLAGHVRGLARGDDDRLEGLIARRLPPLAADRYDEAHRRLAAEIPEFAIWSGRLSDRAAAQSLRRLETLLRRASSGRDPGRHRTALARAYRARLTRPVLGGDAGDLVLPDLGDAYVDPRFQVKTAGAGARPSDETWWDGEVRDDLHAFLATYLTTKDAAAVPLLLLGQPGAGKSSLTHILAARLPASDYLVARVPLRDAPADAEIQDQIELAVRSAIGETVTWAEMAGDAGRPLSVVLLDGFDELLQATGLHRSDYLRRVAAFQERELAQDRPVAVIVTSRVAVADRAHIPAGSPVVRLEPFGEGQIEQWLRVWNEANPAVEPLRPRTLAPLRELAGQPLLLLMLALYHASGNPLAGDIDTAALYERLLSEFAGREVRRVHAGRPESEMPALVEEELLRLSVVAFAMFHRNSQWATEADLDADLAGLGLTPARAAGTERFSAPLTAAQEMVGRFFFIQRARALRDDKHLVTYEFLHATFGEYLVARLVVQAVRDAAARERAATLSLGRGRQPEADLLEDLLGYTPLTARGTVLQFARSMLGPDVRDLLVRRARQAVTRPGFTPGRYRPIDKRVDHWMATYSFNLVLLALAGGGELRASELFTQAADPADWMRGTALQWRAAIPGGMLLDSLGHLEVSRDVRDGRRDMVLRYGSPSPAPLDPNWSNRMRAPENGGYLATFEWGPARNSMTLSNSLSDDTLLHALEPLLTRMPDALRYFVVHDSGEVESIAHGLMALWLAEGPELTDAYRRMTEILLMSTTDDRGSTVDRAGDVVTLVLRALRGDLDRLEPDTVVDLLHRIGACDAAAGPHYAELVLLQLHPHLATAGRGRYDDVLAGNYLTGVDEYHDEFLRLLVTRAAERGDLERLNRAVDRALDTPDSLARAIDLGNEGH